MLQVVYWADFNEWVTSQEGLLPTISITGHGRSQRAIQPSLFVLPSTFTAVGADVQQILEVDFGTNANADDEQIQKDS